MLDKVYAGGTMGSFLCFRSMPYLLPQGKCSFYYNYLNWLIKNVSSSGLELSSDEAGLMRTFFGFGETLVVESEIVNTDVSANTSVSASTIGATS